MSYESDSGEKDYIDPIKGRLNDSGIEVSPDDITSHPCLDEEDTSGDIIHFIDSDGNDCYEYDHDPDSEDTTSYPNFTDGDELLDHPKTLAESELEDQIESSKVIYTQGDRLLSADMVMRAAEGAGISNYEYRKRHNIKLYEKSLSSNDKEQIINTSSPEQRANLANLALKKINAFEILRFAHMSPNNIVHEEEGLDYVRKAAKLQLAIDGEKQDEATIKAAELLLKAEIMKCFEPGNETAGKLFLETQNKIIEYNKEIKKASSNPNFKKKWH